MQRFALILIAVASTVAAQAAGSQASFGPGTGYELEVLYVNSPGHPTNVVPGLGVPFSPVSVVPDLFLSDGDVFGRPWISADGQHWPLSGASLPQRRLFFHNPPAKQPLDPAEAAASGVTVDHALATVSQTHSRQPATPPEGVADIMDLAQQRVAMGRRPGAGAGARYDGPMLTHENSGPAANKRGQHGQRAQVELATSWRGNRTQGAGR